MFAQYPYLNLNDFNLDYILKAIKEMRYEVTNFVSINAIKYADPIQWNITNQYEKNTIVIDPVTGTAYISVAPVPAGVALTRTEYWTVVFDLQSFVTKANQNLANNYEEQTTTTATMNTAANDWVIWGDVLYKALVNITAGDAYIVGSNIQRVVIEDVINAILQDIANEVQARQDADNTINNIIGELDDLSTTDKSSIVNAINEVNQTGGGALELIGDLDDLDTTDKTNLVAAINEVFNAAPDVASELNYVTPEMYGAVGDGVTDDTNAMQAAFDTKKNIFLKGSYLITSDIAITHRGTQSEYEKQIIIGGRIILHDATFHGTLQYDGGTVFCNVVFVADGHYNTPAFTIDNRWIRTRWVLCKFKEIDYVFNCASPSPAFTQELNIIDCHFQDGITAINLDYAQHATRIVRCNIQNYSSYGIYCGGNIDNQNCVIRDSVIELCDIGLKLNHIQRCVLIEGNYFEGNIASSLDLTWLESDASANCNGVLIQNNYFYLNDDKNVIYLPYRISNRLTVYRQGSVIPITIAYNTVVRGSNQTLDSYTFPNGSPSNNAIDIRFLGNKPSAIMRYLHQYDTEITHFDYTFTSAVTAGTNVTLMTQADLLSNLGRDYINELGATIRQSSHSAALWISTSGNIRAYLTENFAVDDVISFDVIYK